MTALDPKLTFHNTIMLPLLKLNFLTQSHPSNGANKRNHLYIPSYHTAHFKTCKHYLEPHYIIYYIIPPNLEPYYIIYYIIPPHLEPYYIIYYIIPPHLEPYYIIYYIIPPHLEPYYIIYYIIPPHLEPYYIKHHHQQILNHLKYSFAYCHRLHKTQTCNTNMTKPVSFQLALISTFMLPSLLILYIILMHF